MVHDPYAPCMCGSGKKLKFCCQDILSDLVKVEKLIDNQPDAAEKLLRSLITQHSDKEVLVTQLASVLTRKGQFDDARNQLVEFLRRHPDEPRALLALADVCLATQGFDASRRIIHRAFQLGARQFPAGVAMLASQIAQQMARAGCAMAVREHLALSVRMAPPEQRNTLLMQLANFESQRTVPYPFRGRFALLPVELDEELQKEERRARQVSQIGCWEPAAILYGRLVEKQPQNGVLWHNLGLFRAWDGRVAEAAKAFHKAADLIDDFDTAVETEALAQLLDLEVDGDAYSIVQVNAPVKSVSQLLTSLDSDGRLARMPLNTNDENEQTARVAAEYELLTEPLSDKVDPDNLPDVLADITVYDADESSGSDAQVLIVALDDDIKEATALFRSVAGDLSDSNEDNEPTPVSRLPQACRLFDWKTHHAEHLGSSHFRKIDRQRLNSALQLWLEQPSKSLGNESPIEAAKDANNLVKVGASVITLDVVCNRMGYDPDLADIRSRLGIPVPLKLEPDEEQAITSLPLLQFARLAESELSDDQVVDFTNRVTLVRHLLLIERAVSELIRRPTALERFTPMRAHMLRATVAREKNDLNMASECFEDARRSVADNQDAFRTKLELDIRELSFRLDDPTDPELPALLTSIRERYFVKIPEIEEVIREELINSGCTHLLDQLQSAAAGADGGLWTPEKEEKAASSEKLWIPGQD